MDRIASDFETLSRRERQCLALVAAGYQTKEIAPLLGIAPGTVDNHLKRVTGSLGMSSRKHLAREFARVAPETVRKLVQELDGGRVSVADQQVVSSDQPATDAEGKDNRAAVPWPVPTQARPWNDLSVRERLGWIVVIAIGSLLAAFTLITLSRHSLVALSS